MKIQVWEFPDYDIGRKYLMGIVVLSRYIISMLPNAFYFQSSDVLYSCSAAEVESCN